MVDTNVIVSAILGPRGGASRRVLRACLTQEVSPLVGTSLFLEYEDVLNRPEILQRSPLSRLDIDSLLNSFLSVCQWVTIFYSWRPNLPDEADHHLIELAVAGNANAIVTKNVRDLAAGELHFPSIEIVTPYQFVEKM